MQDIKSPVFPESIEDGIVFKWHCQPGEHAVRDELLVEIETDKVVIEVRTSSAGRLAEIIRFEGDTVVSGEIIGRLDETDTAYSAAPAEKIAASVELEHEPVQQQLPEPVTMVRPSPSRPQPGPAVRKLLREQGLDEEDIVGRGRGGRLLKQDVEAYIKEHQPVPQPLTAPVADEISETTQVPPVMPFQDVSGTRQQERVPMSRLRATVARRLVQVQQDAAMLTTFNEVDMSALMRLRKSYGDKFSAAHSGLRLGFTTLFVSAAAQTLRQYPIVNAYIDGSDVLYHNYQDIGVAVATERGLVVPVVRNAGALSLPEIEGAITDYSQRAQLGRLQLEEMQGGTFTISNGGVFGSLLSTPLLNPPQTAILGLHGIQDRPVAVDGEVIVRPMMYLALSYDHRLLDGRDAVLFLAKIKELAEDPSLMLLEI